MSTILPTVDSVGMTCEAYRAFWVGLVEDVLCVLWLEAVVGMPYAIVGGISLCMALSVLAL